MSRFQQSSRRVGRLVGGLVAVMAMVEVTAKKHAYVVSPLSFLLSVDPKLAVISLTSCETWSRRLCTTEVLDALLDLAAKLRRRPRGVRLNSGGADHSSLLYANNISWSPTETSSKKELESPDGPLGCSVEWRRYKRQP
eukprot:scaffold349_cov244-Pinguiococcus_pyrenoidosus.AAC.1